MVWSGRGPATALHGSVSGRRFESVSGSHSRQVCQTPFGATSAMNTSRPLAYCGGLSDRLACDDQLADEVAVHVGRPELARASGTSGC